MSFEHCHSNHPKLHAAIGFARRSESAPPLEFETFLDLTTRAMVDGRRFDGIDLALHEAYFSPKAADSEIKDLAANIRGRELVIGSLMTPNLRAGADREAWLENLRQTCRMGRRLRRLGARPYGVIQIDFGYTAATWAQDPFGVQRQAVEDLREACAVADEFGERLAISGANRQGEIQDWRAILDLLVRVNRTGTLGYHVDFAGVLQQWQQVAKNSTLPPPAVQNGRESRMVSSAMKELAADLRPWTISLNVGQTDGVEHPLLLPDPEGRLQIVHHIGPWLHGVDGGLTRGLQHLTWDAGPFPAVILRKQETWDRALAALLAIREAHGWKEKRSRHLDPAQIILLARRAAAESGNEMHSIGPIRRRQTTLKVAVRIKTQPRSLKAKAKAKSKISRPAKSMIRGKSGKSKSKAAVPKHSRSETTKSERAQVKDRAHRAK